MTTIARVDLWGTTIGAVSLGENEKTAAFEYDPSFLRSRVEVSPLKMPLGNTIYQFPELPFNTFHGLPGLLADSLPDKFGNALIDTWLASLGRQPESFNSVERLCYIGSRGIGALEFFPNVGPKQKKSEKVQIDALVGLASDILSRRSDLKTTFEQEKKSDALAEILRIGTSAGGARAKAVIAWNPETNEVRSGQVKADKGFEYWLLKFDGVSGNKDKELEDPQGYGAIEYAYFLMARDAGIEMTESRLLEENGRRHFMTRRFDRTAEGQKIHMQSLCAMAHFDFNLAGVYSYEQALLTIRELSIPMDGSEEMFRRMAFNVLARNQDDHVKNIAFLMDRNGVWKLSPAFDMTYSYNPSGAWTANHQMTLNGKRDGFTREDFEACAKSALLKRGRASDILNQVSKAVSRWREFAAVAKVNQDQIDQIQKAIRSELMLS